MDRETRILAIDYGEKRIGTAISDPLKILAQPFEFIPNDEGTMARLARIVKDKNIERIVMGFPYKDNSDVSEVMKKILVFKSNIEKIFLMEVILVDERYTSSIASQRILDSGAKKNKRRDKSLIDIQSAVIILEDYLRNI